MNLVFRLQNVETENAKLVEEVSKLRVALEKTRSQNETLSDSVEVNEAVIRGLQEGLSEAKVEERKLKDVITRQEQVGSHFEVIGQ